MLAAGSSVDPYWAMFPQHQKPQVREILAPFRIGSLAAADRDKLKQQERDAAAAAAAAAASASATSSTVLPDGWTVDSSGVVVPPAATSPWSYDSSLSRHAALTTLLPQPRNAETPAPLLLTNFITPTELFFIRNHLPVPQIDASRFVLRVDGDGIRSVRLTLDDLRTKFVRHTITAALQCAGNRRSENAARCEPTSRSSCRQGIGMGNRRDWQRNMDRRTAAGCVGLCRP